MNRELKRILKVLLVLTLLFIWGNSLLPASASSQESESVRAFLEPILNMLARLKITADQTLLVRKAAHFSEFFVLGVLMAAVINDPDRSGHYFHAVGLCIAAAVIDETIQLFSDGRGPSVKDVALDSCGAATGVLVCFVVFRLVYRRRAKQKEKEY